MTPPICPQTIGPAVGVKDHVGVLRWHAPEPRPCLGSRCAAWRMWAGWTARGMCGIGTDAVEVDQFPDPAEQS
jgi:hypothetical protein